MIVVSATRALIAMTDVIAAVIITADIVTADIVAADIVVIEAGIVEVDVWTKETKYMKKTMAIEGG